MHFCTEHLKRLPFNTWSDAMDPLCEGDVVIGVRREESLKRAKWPEFVEHSEGHNYRDVWSPIVAVIEVERDALIRRAGFEPLPHRSRECYPCVDSGKADLWDMPAAKIDEIEAHETSMGFTGNGKPRTLFRPAAHGGAVGIRAVVKWANSDTGAFSEEQEMMFSGGCNSGWCGS